MSNTKTLRQIVMDAAEELERNLVPDPRFDARALFAHAYKLDMAHMLLYQEETAEALIPRFFANEAALQKAEEDFAELIIRRARREPLQQILGTTGFYGREFYVTSDVLCPRADTETLIDTVLGDVEAWKKQAANVDKQYRSLLDLCTGSGCIAITLALEADFKPVVAVDISEPALKIAQNNATYNKVGNIEFLASDLYSALPEYMERTGLRSFDVIVSNPPYIPSEVVDTLEPEVRDHEPRIALDGTADGLYFYREIIRRSPEFLSPEGSIYFEIGYDQGQSVSALLQEAGFRDIRVIRDLGDNDRVVTGHL